MSTTRARLEMALSPKVAASLRGNHTTGTTRGVAQMGVRIEAGRGTRWVLVAAALLLVGTVTTAAPARSAPAGDTFERHAFDSPYGSWDYMLYVPPHPKPNQPLVVYIPGAVQSAEQAAYDTRWNELAAKEGFFVLYPEGNLDDGGYFPFMEEEHQHRGAGSPFVIAGMTERAVDEWKIDRTHVFVGGTSNGAAMANVMMATYPDVYAAALAIAGCPYKGQCSAGSSESEPPEHSAAEIVREMGLRARVLPFLVMQGSADVPVNPVLSERTVRSYLLADDAVDNGAADGSIATEPASVRHGQVPGGRSYDVSSYVDAAGSVIGEYWLIHEMRHAYPGGRPWLVPGIAVDPESERKVSPSAADAAAPDGTTIAWEWFLAHPMPRGAR